jgi:hypothetical protein
MRFAHLPKAIFGASYVTQHIGELCKVLEAKRCVYDSEITLRRTTARKQELY